MNYEHESDDLTAGKLGPYTCKHCGQENFEPTAGVPCPERIIKETKKQIKAEATP